MAEDINNKKTKRDHVKPRRIGIIGYGSLGKYLVQEIQERDDLELAFVWNRTSDILKDRVNEHHILENLDDFQARNADLLVEVAHPSITRKYGELFLQHSDYMVGSPTAFADEELEKKLPAVAREHGLYIPSGAFWGGEDIKKMADRRTLQALKVSMTKHPSCFKLNGDLNIKKKEVIERTVLYEGSVRGLCPIAPNNVNTMAAAAMAAYNLGFDKVTGCLISDPSLTDWHIVEVECWGPGDVTSGNAFHVKTVRRNPAQVDAVTGSATYASFLSSMLGARDKGPGIHLC